MITIYYYLSWVSFILFIFFSLVLIIFRKPLYGLGLLFIIPTLFFCIKYNRLLPPPKYMSSEILCATYTYKGIDPTSSSRGRRAEVYYFQFDNNIEFYFRNDIKKHKLDFNKLYINDKFCFTLQRNKDYKNNLRRAKIIKVEKNHKSNSI